MRVHPVFADTMPPVPTYCGECGAPMVRRCVPDGFDTSTGQPLLSTEVACSKVPRSTIFRRGHTFYVIHDASDGSERALEVHPR